MRLIWTVVAAAVLVGGPGGLLAGTAGLKPRPTTQRATALATVGRGFSPGAENEVLVSAAVEPHGRVDRSVAEAYN